MMIDSKVVEKLVSLFVNQEVYIFHYGQSGLQRCNERGVCLKISHGRSKVVIFELEHGHKFGLRIDQLTSTMVDGKVGRRSGRRRIQLVSSVFDEEVAMDYRQRHISRLILMVRSLEEGVSRPAAENYAQEILQSIDHGHVTWSELGFHSKREFLAIKKESVLKKFHKIIELIRYEDMSVQTGKEWLRIIKDEIADGAYEITWDKLEIDEDELATLFAEAAKR